MTIRLIPFLFFSSLSLLAACSDLGYYSQSAGGHLSLMSRRQPIEELLADPDSSAGFREELQSVLDIRAFSEKELFLPVGDSFSTYVDTGRSYVVWNVVAAPAFSLSAKQWCYPVAGCLPYRGYFNQDEAESFAEDLRQGGYDVYAYGVPAYSTLGWFEDSVLNTFVHYPRPVLAGLIFHEMAHQVAYAESDGDFNEAFASTVEIEGVLRWLSAGRGDLTELEYLHRKKRETEFNSLVVATREQLLACYDGRNALSPEGRQHCKDEALAGMQREYQMLKLTWDGYSGYDSWFEQDLNNARFVSVQTYRHYVPAFRELLRQNNHDLQKFYAAACSLAALPSDERQAAMMALQKAALATSADTSADSPLPAVGQSPKSGI